MNSVDLEEELDKVLEDELLEVELLKDELEDEEGVKVVGCKIEINRHKSSGFNSCINVIALDWMAATKDGLARQGEGSETACNRSRN